MIKIICLIPAFFCLILSVSVPIASGEIYRYFDNNGTIRFTDDLNMVPLDQRLTAGEYDELQSALPAAEAPAAPEPSEPIPTLETEADIIEASRKLNATRDSLEAERTRLIQIQEGLQNARGATTSKAKAKQHADEVAQFNKETEAYEEKRQSYEKELARYNAQVDALNRKQPGSDTESDTE